VTKVLLSPTWESSIFPLGSGYVAATRKQLQGVQPFPRAISNLFIRRAYANLELEAIWDDGKNRRVEEASWPGCGLGGGFCPGLGPGVHQIA
jgi:hypothetical protein